MNNVYMCGYRYRGYHIDIDVEAVDEQTYILRAHVNDAAPWMTKFYEETAPRVALPDKFAHEMFHELMNRIDEEFECLEELDET